MPNLTSDFRVSCDFADHWKTRALVNEVGHVGVTCLLRLWAYVAQRRPSGDLSGLPDETLEQIAGWTEAPGAFIAAACKVGFIAGAPGHRRVHDWLEHQPWVEERARKAAAGREAMRRRWLRNSASETTADHTPTRVASETMPQSQPSPSPYTTPSPTCPRPDPTQPNPGDPPSTAAASECGQVQSERPQSTPKPHRETKKPPEAKVKRTGIYRVVVDQDPETGVFRASGITDDDWADWARRTGLSRAVLEAKLGEMLDYCAERPDWYRERARGGAWLITIRRWLERSASDPPRRRERVPSAVLLAEEYGLLNGNVEVRRD